MSMLPEHADHDEHLNMADGPSENRSILFGIPIKTTVLRCLKHVFRVPPLLTIAMKNWHGGGTSKIPKVLLKLIQSGTSHR